MFYWSWLLKKYCSNSIADLLKSILYYRSVADKHDNTKKVSPIIIGDTFLYCRVYCVSCLLPVKSYKTDKRCNV